MELTAVCAFLVKIPYSISNCVTLMEAELSGRGM